MSIEWDKTLNRNNVESLERLIGTKCRLVKKMSQVSNVDSEDIMSKRVKNVKSKEIYFKWLFLEKILDTMYNNVEIVKNVEIKEIYLKLYYL